MERSLFGLTKKFFGYGEKLVRLFYEPKAESIVAFLPEAVYLLYAQRHKGNCICTAQRGPITDII